MLSLFLSLFRLCASLSFFLPFLCLTSVIFTTKQTGWPRRKHSYYWSWSWCFLSMVSLSVSLFESVDMQQTVKRFSFETRIISDTKLSKELHFRMNKSVLVHYFQTEIVSCVPIGRHLNPVKPDTSNNRGEIESEVFIGPFDKMHICLCN